jgi:amino acid adenylation domain-containing protein
MKGFFIDHLANLSQMTAVRSEQQSLTYSELADRAEKLKKTLHEVISSNQAVAICLPRSIELAACVSTCFSIGIPYIPIDPELPSLRIDYMLMQSQPAAILTTRKLAESFSYDSHCIFLDSWLNDHSCSVLPYRRAISNNNALNYSCDTAYVIYTSGSTGKPKGVEMTRAAIENLLQGQVELDIELSAPYRTLQFTSISFDVAVQEILTCFHSGGELVIASMEDVRDPKALLNKLCQHRIERVFMPSTVLQALSEEAILNRDLWPNSLRLVIVAGEKLIITSEIKNFLIGTSARLINQYGPSETHVVTQYSCLTPLSDELEAPAIGKTISNVGIYIVNEQGKPVANGEEGEIWVTGVAVAKGYLGDKEKTDEVFVPNIFDNRSEKLYKTGDLAVKDENGIIHYKRRRQGLIKLNGYRIELAEIESVALQLFQVKYAQSFILSSLNDNNSGQLALFVQVENKITDNMYIRNKLAEFLPKYMIPSQIVVSSTLPLNINKKVDREKIKSLFSPVANYCSEPQGGFEDEIINIYRSILGQKNFSLCDDFFAVGGNSILAMVVVKSLRKKLKLSIDVNDFYRFTTPALLLNYLKNKEV